ncbi:MAG: DUF1492 domain-containing protein [Paludibacteraceae bacterium]|nr:DUF1492 domain-containing protein [Eubacterium sp.]MBR1630464.1 DUF1492 domain-containing protein [Paludibacteraceae bacterium]
MEEKDTSTKAIKNRFRAYADLLREIDNQKERLDRHVASMGPASPNVTGMPHAKGGHHSKVERDVEKKIELEEQIAELVAEEREERKTLEHTIRRIKNPDERAVLRMRYFDREEWQDITHSLFRKAKDYKRNFTNYQRKTYKIHGAALVSFSEALKTEGMNL